MLLPVLLDGTQALACYLWTVPGLEDEALEVLGLLGTAREHSVAAVLGVSSARVILVPGNVILDEFDSLLSWLFEF